MILFKYMMGGALQDERSCVRVRLQYRLKASLLRRGEALLGNVSTSPSNCVGLCVGESMRVSDAVERWRNAL